MDYKIVVDSCGELTGKMKMSGVYTTASLSMQVDGDTIVDDASFDQEDFLKRVAASRSVPNHPALRRKSICGFTRGRRSGCMR